MADQNSNAALGCAQQKSSENDLNSGVSAMAAAEKVYALNTPYAQLRVTETEAYDHMEMRAKQLHNLMLLVTGSGFAVFSSLSDKSQHDVLWLIQQISDEICTLVPIIGNGDPVLKAELEVKA
jgi:hypothetical protein